MLVVKIELLSKSDRYHKVFSLLVRDLSLVEGEWGKRVHITIINNYAISFVIM